jgi:acyl carrier protein
MLSESEARARLTRILAEILILNEDEIHPGSRLVDDLDADSIAFLELHHRLQHDFGLEVPRPKVTEETLGLPLLEGLEKLEELGVEPTLLEFMTQETLRQAEAEPETHRALVRQFTQRLSAGDFRRDLQDALAKAEGDPARRAALGALLPTLRALPVIAPGLGEFLAANPDLAAAWEALAAATEAPPGPAQLSPLWRQVFREAPTRRSLMLVSTRQLASLMATELPPGMPPDLPIGQVQVRELFRFITVDSYVRYILFLAKAQQAGALGQGGEP